MPSASPYFNTPRNPFLDQEVPNYADAVNTIARHAGASSNGLMLDLDTDIDLVEDKTYYTLQSATNNNISGRINESHSAPCPDSPVPSPTNSTSSIFDDIILCTREQSWERTHPQEWNGQQVLEWVFHVVEKWNFDPYLVHGEKFGHLIGQDLTQMSKNDFLQCDPSYGGEFFKCFQNLIQHVQFKPPTSFPTYSPVEDISSVSNSSDSTESDSDLLESIDLDNQVLPPLGPLIPGWDEMDRTPFSDISLEPSDSEEEASMGDPSYTSGSYAPALLPPHSSIMTPFSTDLRETGPCACKDTLSSQYFVNPSSVSFNNTPTIAEPPKKRGPGRPPKNMANYPGQKPAANRPGRKQGQIAKGQKQLWKFIKDLLLSRESNPQLIRWENKDEGVFRIMNSEEVAKQWGRVKNNDKMTYEKMSRAMRFCRDQGYFSEVPKDGNYPKKLCFRFGVKATGWQ